MRFAFFHNLPVGGARRVLYEQIKEFSKRHEIVIYEIQNKESDFLDFSQLKLKRVSYFFELKRSIDIFFGRLVVDYKNFYVLPKLHKKIAKDIDKENFDCVIVHPDRFTQAPFLLAYLKTPSLYYCQEWLRIGYEEIFDIDSDIGITKRLYEKFTRYVRRNIDRTNAVSAKVIVANSNFTKINIDRAYGTKTYVCYPGVNTNIFKKTIETKKSKVVFIGHPSFVTGFDIAKEVTKKLKKYSIELRIIDSSAQPAKSDSELVKEYNESLATFCLGRNEPFGLTAVESMACETPVIALDEGGYKETVIDGKTGFLVNADTKEIASKIELFIKSPDLVSRMGKNARKHAVKNFSWEKHIKCIEEKLSGLIVKKKK